MYKIEIEGTLEECIGVKIKNLRRLKGWTQEDLAKKITLSRPSLSNIEIGRHKLTINLMEQLCKLFEIKSSELLPF